MAQSVAQAFETESINALQSLTIIHQLLKTSLSSITYLRGLFPEETYENYQIGSLVLKNLKRDCNREANSLLDWLEKGIYDALHRHYLRSVVFGIFLDPDEPDKFVESYTFAISYVNGTPSLKIQNDREVLMDARSAAGKGMEEVEKSTRQLLRGLILLTQSLKPLPNKRYLIIKLYYYEQITPKDYEPPFFRPGSDPSNDLFETALEKSIVGQIETGHHDIGLVIQTVPEAFDNEGDEQPTCQSTIYEGRTRHKENYNDETKIAGKKQNGDESIKAEDASTSEIETTGDKSNSHFPCYGYFSPNRVTPSPYYWHVCASCSVSPALHFHSPISSLPQLSSPTSSRLCSAIRTLGTSALFRRALYQIWCSGFPSTCKQFSLNLGVKPFVARTLQKMLAEDGFIVQRLGRKRGTAPYEVVRSDECKKMFGAWFVEFEGREEQINDGVEHGMTSAADEGQNVIPRQSYERETGVYVERNEKEHQADESSCGKVKPSHIDANPSPADDNPRGIDTYPSDDLVSSRHRGRGTEKVDNPRSQNKKRKISATSK
ncbi:1663_t:CDS:10 [Paraglomus occultum]|uniref:1663_t:CDS:1 n=1 Tax=Paraglomus occultum TaxID=144539 RepID=A0A9N8W0A8_9GLOM|nr:1663_t:CDS:10 [Paraglomus occultum]